VHLGLKYGVGITSHLVVVIVFAITVAATLVLAVLVFCCSVHYDSDSFTMHYRQLIIERDIWS
jgi:hypothetical protein